MKTALDYKWLAMKIHNKHPGHVKCQLSTRIYLFAEGFVHDACLRVWFATSRAQCSLWILPSLPRCQFPLVSNIQYITKVELGTFIGRVLASIEGCSLWRLKIQSCKQIWTIKPHDRRASVLLIGHYLTMSDRQPVKRYVSVNSLKG